MFVVWGKETREALSFSTRREGKERQKAWWKDFSLDCWVKGEKEGEGKGEECHSAMRRRRKKKSDWSKSKEGDWQASVAKVSQCIFFFFAAFFFSMVKKKSERRKKAEKCAGNIFPPIFAYFFYFFFYNSVRLWHLKKLSDPSPPPSLLSSPFLLCDVYEGVFRTFSFFSLSFLLISDQLDNLAQAKARACCFEWDEWLE